MSTSSRPCLSSNAGRHQRSSMPWAATILSRYCYCMCISRPAQSRNQLCPEDLQVGYVCDRIEGVGRFRCWTAVILAATVVDVNTINCRDMPFLAGAEAFCLDIRPFRRELWLQPHHPAHEIHSTAAGNPPRRPRARLPWRLWRS